MLVSTASTAPLALDSALLAPLIAGAFGVLVVVLRALGWLISAPRDRRRDLYGNAYRDAMAWQEMLYRIRRRATDAESEWALIERFHELQERIDWHRGWLGSESRLLARSYCRLVEQVKCRSEPLIVAAWGEPPRAPGAPAPDGEQHVSVEEESLRFLRDVRSHLSYWPIVPLALLAWRNRDTKGEQA